MPKFDFGQGIENTKTILHEARGVPEAGDGALDD
jgi:hypothetical protein